jgi:two-component system, cell cycle response regulator
MTTSTILIVEDNQIACEILEDLLAPEGYKLLFAHDGPTAVKTAVSHTPDLILLDIMLPGMSGFEVCRQIRQTELTAAIPIIMVTALNNHRFRVQGIEAGADDFVTKPFEPQELYLRVKNITRLNRYRRLLVENKKLEHVLNHAAHGYLVLNEKGEIAFANRQAQRYLNCPINDATPAAERQFGTIVEATFRQEPAMAWHNWPDPAPDKMPRYLLRPEDKWFKAQWLQVDVLAYQADDVQNWLITLQDVTEKIQDLRDMRSFQTMVSHKLRTPLVGIIGSLFAIEKETLSLASEQIEQSITIAQQNAAQLQGQIEDVLRYSQLPILSHDGVGLELGLLPELVTHAAETVGIGQLRWLSDPASINGRINLPAQTIEVILYELLENARKFHPDQKPMVEVALKQDNGFIILILRDNGRYLPPEQLERVWAPYYQFEKTFTGQIPGMGLGLSTVATLVWQAKGYCRLYNRADRPGVSVEIKLPLQNESSA